MRVFTWALVCRMPRPPHHMEPQGLPDTDLVDFTPELRAEALETVKRYRIGGAYDAAARRTQGRHRERHPLRRRPEHHASLLLVKSAARSIRDRSLP